MMEGGFHKLAIKDENVLDQLQRQFRNVYDETQNTEFGTDAHEILRRGRIRLTYVQPPVTVDDINVPEPTEDGDDVQARVTAWSGLPPPGELLSQYEVASAAPGCLCLRRQGKEEVSVVMLEFRPRAMLEDCIPLSKEAADFLLQFRTDPPADPAMEPLRLVYSFYSSEWPQEEMAMCSYAPEVHFYPDGSCGLRRLEHIARTTMIPTCFDAPDVPGWLAIRVHSDGVFVCRDYFCTYDERQDAEELMLELHEEFEELRQPLPTLPQAQQQAEQQAAQQQAQQPEQQGTQQQQQQQQPQPRGRRRQRQQQQQRQQQSQQQPQIQQAQQPDQQPGAAAGPAGAAGAGAGPEVWPSFRPATYLGALDGFRKQCNWRMSGTIFAALHLNSSVLTEGGSTVIKEVQAGFLGRGPADKGDLTVHYGGTFAGGRFTRGTSTSTLHFRINKNTVKMTALKYLVRAMHGGQLPPEDSWLALVRHQDGSISAHIWLKESKEAEMLKQYDVKLTPVIKAAQLQEAARLQAEQPTAQDGAAAGQAQAQPPQAPAAQVAASSGSDAQQDAQDGDGSSSEEEEEEGSQAAEEEEEGADEEEVEAALQQAEPAARAAGWAGAAVAPAAEAAAIAGPAEEAPEGSEEEAEEGNVGSAEAGAAVPSAAESSDESRAAAALGLLRQDPAAVVGPRPVQKQTRQEKEASRLAAARHQAQAREEAGSRSRDARALARRQTAEAQQRKRGAEQEPGPSQPPSKRQQREKRRAAAAAAAAAGAAGGSGAVASTGPSASRPPPKQAQLQAAKRQRTGQQQQQQESPASLGQQVPPNRQQPVGGEAIVQQQEQQQQGQQLRRRPGRPKKQKGPQAMARQQEPPANELGEQQQQQQREQEEQEQQQAQLQQQEQQAAGAAAAGAEQPAGAAAAAAGVDEPQAQLPPCVLQLLQDVLGSRPGVIASLASYLVSQGLSMFSDLGHLTDSELVAGTAGLTSLLVRRLRWVWFARGWGEQQQLTAEEVTLLEHDYEAMQEFYAMGAWS